jgi:hypothetical protein
MGNVKITGRIPALQTCVTQQWSAGQQLGSKSWKTHRRLMGTVAFDAQAAKGTTQAVRVMVLKPDGTMLRDELLHTFPSDIYAIGS